MSAEIEHLRFSPFRQVGEIQIIHVDLTPHEPREQYALEWLDNEELARWRRYIPDRPRREFALCRAVLRYSLCRRLGCENNQLSIVAASYGKPHALINGQPAPTSFNVSHSGPHGLIAFAQGKQRVGVDVEAPSSRRRDFDGIAEMVFGPNERAEIASANGLAKSRLFFRFWTLKEAIVKAFGTGLSIDLTAFEIPPDIRHGAESSTFRFPGQNRTLWELQDLSTNGYAAAIAAEVSDSAKVS
ncbi:MAG: 4'-phosphopantetheinyl transferase superfamily protein [Rhodothermaceae bacterium]|nr:4'-phosphopantetheinyl transferase superfamily protein [Rhodothermaceae bacterium]